MWHIAKRLALGVFLIVAAAAVLLVSDWKHRRGDTKRPWKIVLVRYVDAQFAEDTTRGIEAGLAEAGLQQGRDFTLKIISAQGDIVTLNSIMDAVKTEEADLVMTISTPTLQAALRRFHKTPVVFTTVANAVVAGAGASNTDHQPNVTGVSTASAYAEVAEVLHECLPLARRVGTVFTPGEANCVYNREQMAKALQEYDIELVAVAANSPTEVSDAATALCSRDIDALAQVVSNMLDSSFPSIVRAADKMDLPIFGFMSDAPRKGAVMAVARDYFDAGREGALVAARVIRGEDPAEIPFANLKTTRLVVNLRKARKLGVTIPDSLLERADEVIK